MGEKRSTHPLVVGEDQGALESHGWGLSDGSSFGGMPVTEDFLSDRSIKTSAGTCNILVVAPNLSSAANLYENIGSFCLRLTQMLGAYGIINCGLYRKPVKGDPSPEELKFDRPSSKRKKRDKKTTLRCRLLNETGGVPVDLNFFNPASVVRTSTSNASG